MSDFLDPKNPLLWICLFVLAACIIGPSGGIRHLLGG